MTRIRVVTAVIVRGGKLFLAQRKAPRDFSGLWECPGGKVEADDSRCKFRWRCEKCSSVFHGHAPTNGCPSCGSTIVQEAPPIGDTADTVALHRELREELNVESTVGEMICSFSIDLPTSGPSIVTFYATEIVGEPELREHMAFEWAQVFSTLSSHHMQDFKLTPAGELARPALLAYMRRKR